MNVLLIAIGILILISFSINVIRHFKLRSLQKKRNNCDLTTVEGKLKLKEYNERINRLMNYNDGK